MLTTAGCLVVRLALGFGLDSVSGWLVVMHTYLYYFRLSLSHCPIGVQSLQGGPKKVSHYHEPSLNRIITRY